MAPHACFYYYEPVRLPDIVEGTILMLLKRIQNRAKVDFFFLFSYPVFESCSLYFLEDFARLL